jgi:hypothetical protein
MNSILFVSESKLQLETISYFGDFRDLLLPGEQITSETVTVTLLTGTDSNPSAMLYGGISVHNQNIIEQKIRQGVPGNIYDIIFTVGTNQGHTYEKVTRLAILPNNLTAPSLHTTIWLTSWNYPYNILPDNIQGTSGLNSNGNFWYQPKFKDSFQGNASINSGNLFAGSISYAIKPESIQGSTTINSGTLTLVVITYNMRPEAIKGGVAINSGDLYQGSVSYTMKAESIQGNTILNSGTLA